MFAVNNNKKRNMLIYNTTFQVDAYQRKYDQPQKRNGDSEIKVKNATIK